MRVEPAFAEVPTMPAGVALPVEPDLRVDPVVPVAPVRPVLALRRAGFAAAHVAAEPVALFVPELFGVFLDLVDACLPPREAR